MRLAVEHLTPNAEPEKVRQKFQEGFSVPNFFEKSLDFSHSDNYNKFKECRK